MGTDREGRNTPQAIEICAHQYPSILGAEGRLKTVVVAIPVFDGHLTISAAKRGSHVSLHYLSSRTRESKALQILSFFWVTVEIRRMTCTCRRGGEE